MSAINSYCCPNHTLNQVTSSSSSILSPSPFIDLIRLVQNWWVSCGSKWRLWPVFFLLCFLVYSSGWVNATAAVLLPDAVQLCGIKIGLVSCQRALVKKQWARHSFRQTLSPPAGVGRPVAALRHYFEPFSAFVPYDILFIHFIYLLPFSVALDEICFPLYKDLYIPKLISTVDTSQGHELL